MLEWKKRYKSIHSAEKLLEITKFWEKKNIIFFKDVDSSMLFNSSGRPYM